MWTLVFWGVVVLLVQKSNDNTRWMMWADALQLVKQVAVVLMKALWTGVCVLVTFIGTAWLHERLRM